VFTGIVQLVGHIAQITPLGPEQVRLVVTATFPDTTPGESIAVNGVCLTVAELAPTGFAADVMSETLRRTTLGALKPGAAVNLERAATPVTHLGGHIVQGHVDGTGSVISREPSGDFDEITIGLPAALAKYVAEKGSIAIEGVSLTVVGVGDEDDSHWLRVALIPTTLAHTTLGELAPGAAVNLEVDVIAKYVERLLAAGRP
jgi:riboflavin synthase